MLQPLGLHYLVTLALRDLPSIRSVRRGAPLVLSHVGASMVLAGAFVLPITSHAHSELADLKGWATWKI